jgi:hypothetical protein
MLLFKAGAPHHLDQTAITKIPVKSHLCMIAQSAVAADPAGFESL